MVTKTDKNPWIEHHLLKLKRNFLGFMDRIGSTFAAIHMFKYESQCFFCLGLGGNGGNLAETPCARINTFDKDFQKFVFIR